MGKQLSLQKWQIIIYKKYLMTMLKAFYLLPVVVGQNKLERFWPEDFKASLVFERKARNWYTERTYKKLTWKP